MSPLARLCTTPYTEKQSADSAYFIEAERSATNLRQIKAARWQQAFLGETPVSCPSGGLWPSGAARGSCWRLSVVGTLGPHQECTD